MYLHFYSETLKNINIFGTIKNGRAVLLAKYNLGHYSRLMWYIQ